VGIDILQPSISIPTSATIDHCSLTNQTAGTYPDGVAVENGRYFRIEDAFLRSDGLVKGLDRHW
jgi:hypothetical protein